jgi:hypothetical protein
VHVASKPKPGSTYLPPLFSQLSLSSSSRPHNNRSSPMTHGTRSKDIEPNGCLVFVCIDAYTKIHTTSNASSPPFPVTPDLLIWHANITMRTMTLLTHPYQHQARFSRQTHPAETATTVDLTRTCWISVRALASSQRKVRYGISKGGRGDDHQSRIVGSKNKEEDQRTRPIIEWGLTQPKH